MYQYKNAKGETFGIIHSDSSTLAYINGRCVAEAETERGLESMIENFSHESQEITKRYLGISK